MPSSEMPTRVLSEGEVSEDSDSRHEFESAWTDPPPGDASADPLIGTTLNRTFTLKRVIGEGGMGRVYEAHHTRIRNKRYAIKVLHPELAHAQDVRSRFQREAEAAACVSHPSAVAVYDVALTPQGWPYLVCEYLDGIELARHIKDSAPLSEATVKHVALQVCDALAEAHGGGVIHRDLKPQNIFLVGDFAKGVPEFPTAKVLDFGLSRFMDGSDDNNLTKTGVILGTPSYMAPEQARGLKSDHRTDIYGLGAVLYAALAGRAPFRGDTPQAVLLAVMNDEPVRPTTLNPKLSADMEVVIQRAMAKEPDERYPDMQSLRAALAAVDTGPLVVAPPSGLPGSGGGASAHAATIELGEASAARSQLVGLVLAGVVGFSAALAAAIAGGAMMVFGRWPLSPLETVLSLLVIFGTLLTPTVLFLRKVRRRIWGNTARVVEALFRGRRLGMVGTLTYGVAALGVLFWDHVAARLGEGEIFVGPSGLAWPGMPVVLFSAALVVVILEMGRGRLLLQGGWVSRPASSERKRLRSFVAGPLLSSLSVSVAALVLMLGVVWRGSSSAPSSKSDGEALSSEPNQPTSADGALPETEPSGVDAGEKEAARPRAEPTAQPTAAPSARAEVALATKQELTAGISRGLDGLLPLLDRYPDDPKVLRAVGVHHAARSSGLVDALVLFERLFERAPRYLDDKDLRHMILQMTETRGAARPKAYTLLALGMGTTGPDLLYRLALTKPKQKDEALRYLAKANKAGKFAPALSIAYELRFLSSCAARVPLLPRAAKHGDRRSIQVLASLSTPPKRCGYKGKPACVPICPAQAAQFQDTITTITERGGDR